MYGWAGQILHIDLTKKKIVKEPFERKLGEPLLGGRGVNAKILWDLLEPGIDAYNPRNHFIIGAGPLIGTEAPSAGRISITCKGPMTNLYLKTGTGGKFGIEMKYAGYDHIDITGRSENPQYIWIDDEQIEFRDASHLWGKDIRETHEIIAKDLGDDDARIICIGPAGENLVRFANVMNTEYHSASKGGAGAVLGSKKLKAMAVRGSGYVEVKNPKRFHELAVNFREAIRKDGIMRWYYDYGTSGMMEGANEFHVFPVNNWQRGHADNLWPITGQCFEKEGYLVRRESCSGCPAACIRFNVIASGPYAGTRTQGPQYETCVKLGSNLGIFDTASLIKNHALCNQYGLDGSTAGSTISWAMESFERGVLSKEDCDGLDLGFGNAEAVVKLIPMIAKRQGKIGNLLAEGSYRASKKVGKDSWKWSLHNSKKMDITAVDLRGTNAYALSFAVNPRGPDHLLSETATDLALSEEAAELVEKITGKKGLADPRITEGKAQIVRWHEDIYAASDAIGLCVFYNTASYVLDETMMADLFTHATGVEKSASELMLAGRRIMTLEKCINIREGADRKLDDLPYRMMNEPAPAGPIKGLMVSKEKLDKMLDEYYTLNGWDIETSWPHKKTLIDIGLKDVAEELQKIGKLPKSKKE